MKAKASQISVSGSSTTKTANPKRDPKFWAWMDELAKDWNVIGPNGSEADRKKLFASRLERAKAGEGCLTTKEANKKLEEMLVYFNSHLGEYCDEMTRQRNIEEKTIGGIPLHIRQ